MKIPRRRINKSALIMAVPSVFLLLVSIFGFSAPLQAADGNKLVFAYSEASVYQEVSVPNNWSTASTLTATVSAAEVQDWKASSDVLAVAIDLYGDGGGGIYSHGTGYITLTDGGTFNDYSVTVTAAGVGAGWASVTSVRISIIGRDGEFWAGNYGTQVETASLELDGVELLTNTEFATNSEWTSSLGWQTCSGGSGAQPCIGTSAVEINNPTPTALEVTSLLDDGSDGTLRWAINQANATAGGIYDAITITTEGTITLTSDLPAITEGVTITGTGMATTIIDGDNLYRSLNNNGTRTIAVSDVTFKRGKAANGGIGYTNNGGTFTFTRVKFTDMTSGSAWFQSNANVTTFTDSEFSALSIGIQSDYGSTPSALSQTDSDYTNRIYIDGSTFTNNTYGIRTERFVKINNSQFTDNTYGAVLRGLNRQQVLNSVFTSNFIGVNFSSWIPTSWTPGAGNQTVSGSTFNGNTYGIQFANNFNNGSTIYNDVSANSWSTSTGNTFGATAMNTANYSGTGYVTEGDTITAAFYNAVQNLTATANEDGSVVLNWGAPVVSNYDRIDIYVVSFYDMDDGIQSGGWGVWTDSENMTYTLSTEMFDGTTGYGPVRFAVKAGSDACVGRNDPLGSCLYGPQAYVDATVLDPTPVTTTTSSTTTTTTVYEPPVVVVPPVDTGPIDIDPIDIEPIETEPIDTDPIETDPEIQLPTETIPEYSEPVETEPIETEPVEVDNPVDIILPEEVQDAADAAVEDIFDGPLSNGALADAVDDLITDANTPEELTAVVDSLLSQDLNDEQFSIVIDSLFDGPMSDENFNAAVDAVFSEPLTIEQFSAALDSVFDEPISDEKFDAIISTVLDEPLTEEQFSELVNVLESETVTEDQVSAAVDSIIENEISADQSAELSASPKVLESITPEQATEVFASLDIANVSPEQEAELAAALTDAPQDIKEALEQEVDIYGDGFDDYTAVGSNIEVGTRKTLIAATTVLAAAAASMGGTGGDLGGGSGSGGGPSNNKPGGDGMPAGRKEEEEEEGIEIEGPEGPEKGNFTKNSIFKYQEGTMSKKFSPWGFIKKFSRETAAMAFTISGSVIVFATLSGDTRRITLISTLSAFAVHYVYVMLKNDED